MNLPKRRKRERSGIERVPQRIFQRHRKFVRSHSCCVPGCAGLPIEFAHVRSAANSGVGLKPHDSAGVALCAIHHLSQHMLGMVTFQALHKIDMKALAAEFTRRSPDVEMKASLKLVSAEELENV